MEPAFSRAGEAPTAFERELIAHAEGVDPATVREMWVQLAQLVGPDRLFTVLDHLGGGMVWMPTRQQLVNTVWVDVRDAEIRRRRELHGESLGSMSRAFGITRSGVARVLSATHGSRTGKRAMSRK